MSNKVTSNHIHADLDRVPCPEDTILTSNDKILNDDFKYMYPGLAKLGRKSRVRLRNQNRICDKVGITLTDAELLSINAREHEHVNQETPMQKWVRETNERISHILSEFGKYLRGEKRENS